ncbi:TonB-dependent receptor [Natronoflexus pectinivorans]|uniref:TonB dependent receptor n=1 Tax=Natronoflexus pectinivorans TaxID=682526 RepID=A0A4R2GFD8_9BACT|nr:TonB-dependent receptor [Natronoflexus pectinivorans]TCO06915.1 hypothetical protein EV194_11131 [Natronoflexus pectinivorans]
MRNSRIISICMIGMLLTTTGLFSQEETPISQDVRVVREYTPTVSDAIKISEMPDISEPDIPAPRFEYRLSGRAITGAPEVVPLIPARMAPAPPEELNTSYIKGYAGNYDLLGGALYYNLVQNNDFAIALKAGHESSWGRLTVDGDKNKAHYHDTNGGLFMRHFFRGKTLSLDMDFNNYAYRYYGGRNMHPESIYRIAVPDSDPEAFRNVPGAELVPDPTQHQTTFDIDLGLLNHVNHSNSTRYDMGLGFSTFGNRTGVTENQFRYRGDFDIPIGELFLRLGTSLNHASVNHGNNAFLAQSDFGGRQQTLVEANPAMLRIGGHYMLNMGLRIGAEFDDIEDNFYLSPDVWGRVAIADGVVGLKGGVTGEIRPATYRNIMAENPFAAPDMHVKTAFHGVKFFMGATANFSAMTTFSAKVEYNVFRDEHFFVNRRYLYEDQSQYEYANIFDVVYDDGQLLTVSGELNLNFSPDLDLMLRGAYYSWTLDEQEHAWHKPGMEIGVRASYHMDESLTLFGAFNLLGDRQAKIPLDLGTEVITLDPVFDFNLGANYALNKRWNFFGEFRNMFASRYYQWHGYPMKGFNARIGAGYSF